MRAICASVLVLDSAARSAALRDCDVDDICDGRRARCRGRVADVAVLPRRACLQQASRSIVCVMS